MLSSGQEFDKKFLDSKHILKVSFQPGRKKIFCIFTTSYFACPAQDSPLKYWENEKTWRWRDLWEIGFIEGGYGVDYPFMNNAQYPSKIIPFYVQKQVRMESDLSVTGITTIIDDFLIDGCE